MWTTLFLLSLFFLLLLPPAPATAWGELWKLPVRGDFGGERLGGDGANVVWGMGGEGCMGMGVLPV